MVDIIFNGYISIEDKNKDAFIEDFNNFLVSREAAFKGTIRVIEFDDPEIIDD